MRRVLFGLVLCSSFLTGCAVPSRTESTSPSYGIGERVDSETTVLDSSMKTVRLWDQVRNDKEVVVLILFGGGAVTPPTDTFRGPLWCEDSFDDLAVQRAMIHQFRGQPVQFLAVAVPPVYSPARFGFPDGAFSQEPSGPTRMSDPAVREFVEATVRQKNSSLLPYPEIFFDPTLQLLESSQTNDQTKWEGKLKWPQDPRKYGVPTIWILSNSGEVLREPFWGNDYDSSPPQIHYGFEDLRSAVEEALDRSRTP